MKDKKQVGGDESTNYQADQINIQQTGLTYADTRQLFLDLFADNFEKLRKEAAEVAVERATSLVDNLMERMAREAPERIEAARDPAFQLSVYAAQREAVRGGTEDVEKLLIELLMSRTKEQSRSLRQVVMDECVTLGAKISEPQLAASVIASATGVQCVIDCG